VFFCLSNGLCFQVRIKKSISYDLKEVVVALVVDERWSRFAGQFGGLAKVDSGFDYAANFSSFACLA
jgi:hypothetical protein